MRIDTEYILANFGPEPLAACLANNHIMNYGTDPFEGTLTISDSLEILYFGTGRIQESLNNSLPRKVDESALQQIRKELEETIILGQDRQLYEEMTEVSGA